MFSTPRPAASTHLALAAAVLASAGTSTVLACSSERSLETLAGDADLVFRGEIQDIRYAMSEPGGPEGTRVPHTFVTYRVDDVLRGDNPGLVLTLRFVGGLDQESLRYTTASHVPQFDVGDEDILFVRDNGQSICPLVGHDDGRLRVIGGQLYSETGRAVSLERDGTLLMGDRFRLPEVMSTTVLGRVFPRGLGPDLKDGPSDAMTAEALAEAVDRMALPAPAGAFASADAALPFDGPDMTPAAPPADAGAPDEEDEATRLERQQAEREAAAK